MAICDCTKLRHLRLYRAFDFVDRHLEKLIRNVPNLETLNASSCDELTGAGSQRIQDLRKLRSLHIAGNAVSSDAFTGLGEISTLRNRSLIGSNIDIGILPSVARLNDLRSLTLDFAIESEDFSMICENFKMLEMLALRDCRRLSDAEGMKIRTSKHLTSITLYICPEFTDRTFESGLGSSALEDIALSGCDLTDVGLASMAAHHGRLRSLSFGRCEKHTAIGVASLVEREPYLRDLSLSTCTRLSDKLVSLLEPVCPRLRHSLICQAILDDREAVQRFERTTSCRMLW